jgi:hypothetical protein
MSTEKQIKANRLNAQSSTGPSTPGGKARTSMNAVKHGLTARQIVLPSEDQDEFDSFRADLFSSLNPQSAFEAVLVERIVTTAWRLRRIPMLELAFFQRVYLEHAEWLARPRESAVNRRKTLELITIGQQESHQGAKRRENEQPDHDPLFYITEVLKRNSQELSNLSRHEAALIRTWFRTVHELERSWARRAGEYVPAPAVMDVNVNVAEDLQPIGRTAPNDKTVKHHSND